MEVDRKLLEAPALPETDSEMGCCVWCGGTGYSRSSADFKTHMGDCPWVQARKLLGREMTDE